MDGLPLLLNDPRRLLYVGGILFIIGTGSERFSTYIKERGKTPYYIGLKKLEKAEELRRFLSTKRAELHRSENNQIIVFENSEHELVEHLRQLASAPENSRFPVRLVETDTPVVNIKDITTGERIGSTEYPPAVLTAHGWDMDYDNLIMGLERDTKQYIKSRIRIFNYVGYTLIILGTLIMAYAGLLTSLQ